MRLKTQLVKGPAVPNVSAHYPQIMCALGYCQPFPKAGCKYGDEFNWLHFGQECDPSGWEHLLSLPSSCKMVNICEFMKKKRKPNIQDLYQLQISTEVSF